MKAVKTIIGHRMEVLPEGKIDALTAPRLQEEIIGQMDGITELIIDFGAVEYISSAGLRTILFLQQALDKVNGTLTVRRVSPLVMNIFEVTDFDQVIRIE